MGILAGFIVPHPPLAVEKIGKQDIELIPETISSFERVAKEIAQLKPDTIILTSPHATSYADYFHISPGKGASGDFKAFGAGDIRIDVEYDQELVAYISSFCEDAFFPAGTMGEQDPTLDHGTMVPLYYINKYYTDYQLVRIGLSGLGMDDHFRFGRFISKSAKKINKKIVFVASGDLSHCQREDGPYGYRPEGPRYDEKLMGVLKAGKLKNLLDFDKELLDAAAECGHGSFTIMAGAFEDYEYSMEALSHENTFGVGYGFAIVKVLGDSLILEGIRDINVADPLVALAVDTIESHVMGVEPREFVMTDEMRTRRGTFVSIHKSDGSLRGCIGTILPTKNNLAQEIIANAKSASTNDPRFSPIREDELDDLVVNVDVLTEPEQIFSMDDLDPKVYGVIVTSGNRLGVLLPDLEGVDTVEEQVSIAMQKAGIPAGESIDLHRFKVDRHI